MRVPESVVISDLDDDETEFRRDNAEVATLSANNDFAASRFAVAGSQAC